MRLRFDPLGKILGEGEFFHQGAGTWIWVLFCFILASIEDQYLIMNPLEAANGDNLSLTFHYSLE